MLIEVAARRLLLVALAVAAGADPVQEVDEEDRDPRADDPGRALERPIGADDDHRDDAGDDDDRRQPVADEPQRGHAAARAVGVKAASAASRSPGSPTERSSCARTSAGESPSAARSASVTAPWRLARRAPSGPSMSGTCA